MNTNGAKDFFCQVRVQEFHLWWGTKRTLTSTVGSAAGAVARAAAGATAAAAGAAAG